MGLGLGLAWGRLDSGCSAWHGEGEAFFFLFPVRLSICLFVRLCGRSSGGGCGGWDGMLRKGVFGLVRG